MQLLAIDCAVATTLQLLICERAVMQTLGFFLTVDHVHMRLRDAVKQLCEGRTAGSRGSDVTAKSGTSKPATPRDATAALTLAPTARRELITAAEHIVSAL
jgi:hypothetical protein